MVALLRVAAVLIISSLPAATRATGVVTNCTEADLRTALAGGGLVTFDCDGTIVLTNTLTITSSTVIDGSGHAVVISGGGAVRPFVVPPRTSQLDPPVVFTLKNVTVADGLSANSGGAILCQRSARLIDCTFSNNTANTGGAVYQNGRDVDRLDISGCAFLFNRAVSSNNGFGGAVAVPDRQQLNITNSTFFGNVAFSFGGAISYNFLQPPGFGAANVLNSTFAGNSNGAVASYRAPMLLMNCLFANNNGSNCLGVTDGGYNISSDASGGFTHPFSLQNVDPRLMPLADNGGPTLTMALLPDSPAIDGGSSTAMPHTDERGVTRPFGASSDAGAYEFTPTGTGSGEFHLFAATNIVSETAGSVAFRVLRAGGTEGEASVSFATGNGTATSASDFVATNGVLLFGAGQQSNTVFVAVLNDSAVEGNENFHMALSNPTGGASLGRAVAGVTIADNDSSFQFSSANYSAGEETGSLVATVLRAGSVNGIASVNIATSQGTALSGADFLPTNGVLNFVSGQTSATVNVTIVDDVAPEPTKTFTLQLSSPTGGTSLGTPAAATISIIDNEPLQHGALQFSVASYSVSEASGEVLLSVVRVGGTNGVVTATYSTSQGTAHSGSDFAATNGTLVFGDTETRKWIRVAVSADAAAEGPESFAVELSNPTGGATLGDPVVATVTILDGTHTLTTCDETSLRAAVGAGGQVVLACDGTIFLSAPLQVSGGVIVDASGHSVTISGSNAVRLFVIQPGVTLTLRSLALADGLARGTNGNAGQPGESAQGGAICNSNGAVNAYDCAFLGNRVLGGNGGPTSVSLAGTGGEATGGAIYNWLGSLQAINCSFRSNSAAGGTGGGGFFPRSGGGASGGAVYNLFGSVSTSNCVFVANRAGGGSASDGAFASGGEARGGAFCNISGAVHVVSAILSSNVALAGKGNRFVRAAGYGGSFFNTGDAVLMGSRLDGNFAISEPLREAGGGALAHVGQGILSLTDCAVSDNRAVGGDGQGIGSPLGAPGRPGLGGGLYIAAGDARLTNTTLANNLALGGVGVPSGAGAGQGGGLYTTGDVFLVNCTLAANAARGGEGRGSPGGDGEGGGVYKAGGSRLTLLHCTIASNSAAAGSSGNAAGASRGGAIAVASDSVTLRSTILAHSLSSSNCHGSGFVDEGHNLSSDASCPLTAAGSVINTDPRLGPLADYGGLTPTMALLAGSPALNTADPAFCPATDQRGRPRPFGTGCDIGAFESSSPYTILGQVHGFRTPASGIQVTASATSTSVPADGHFVLHGFAAGTYLLSLASPECVFDPRTRSVTVGPDVVGVSFLSYRSNALVIERLSANAVRCVFAGEDGTTYHVLSGTNLPGLTLYTTNQTQSNGLFEFAEGTASAPKRFFQVVRP